jgi:hypothetical protein
LKLSSGVSSKKPFYTSNSCIFCPNPEFGSQNIVAVRKGNYINLSLSGSYFTAGDVVDPPPPTLLGQVKGWGRGLL